MHSWFHSTGPDGCLYPACSFSEHRKLLVFVEVANCWSVTLQVILFEKKMLV